ncbi:MAG: hypothetical protein R6U65_07280 [Perlabentimonas sp.]
MYTKGITVFPEAYHAVKLEVSGTSWEECNQKLRQEYNRIKHRLPKDEILIVEELL